MDEFRDSNASGSELVAAGAKVGEGVGSTLMNASVAAAPYAPLVGAGLAGLGAGLWVTSRATRAVARRWEGSVGKTAKSMWDDAKAAGKNAFNKV